MQRADDAQRAVACAVDMQHKGSFLTWIALTSLPGDRSLLENQEHRGGV
jgi:hypothetical protein